MPRKRFGRTHGAVAPTSGPVASPCWGDAPARGAVGPTSGPVASPLWGGRPSVRGGRPSAGGLGPSTGMQPAHSWGHRPSTGMQPAHSWGQRPRTSGKTPEAKGRPGRFAGQTRLSSAHPPQSRAETLETKALSALSWAQPPLLWGKREDLVPDRASNLFKEPGSERVFGKSPAPTVETFQTPSERSVEASVSLFGWNLFLGAQAHEEPPAPRFHAYRARVRKDLYDLYAEFVAAFRVAAEKLRSGDRHAAFPLGSFPPTCLSSGRFPLGRSLDDFRSKTPLYPFARPRPSLAWAMAALRSRLWFRIHRMPGTAMMRLRVLGLRAVGTYL